MTNHQLRTMALATLGLLAACSGPGQDSPLGQQAARLSTPSTGLVPYPVRIVDGSPVYDESGRPLPGWDGTVVDLLASDAWAQCSAHTGAGSDGPGGDQYLEYLEERITSARCPLTAWAPSLSSGFAINDCTTMSCAPVKQWATQRLNPDCNVDTSTGTRKAVRFYANGTIGHSLPIAPGVTGSAATGVFRSAQRLLDVAEVNLCIAQRLREHLVSADILFMTAADQRELLEVTRQRAQVAVLQYGLLGLGFANPDSSGGIGGVATDDNQALLALQAVGADAPSGSLLAAIGLDFAGAVRLHIDATSELAELLARSAGARSARGGSSSSAAEEQWGAGSWRQRLAALLYGGNPLMTESGELDLATTPSGFNLDEWYLGRERTPWGPPDSVHSTWLSPGPGEHWPNTMVGLAPPQPYAKTGWGSPQIALALGLARQADALVLKERTADFTTSTPIPANVPLKRYDAPESGLRIYQLLEAWILRSDCLGAGGSSCAITPTDSRIPPAAEYERSLLWQRHRVGPEHTAQLASILAEAAPHQEPTEASARIALLGAPVSSVETEGAVHIIGAHQKLEGSTLTAKIPDATGRWVVLDKASAISFPTPAELAPLYSKDGSHWLPRQFEKTIPPELQGFRAERLRRMGAISALAAVRELVEDGRASGGLTGSYFAQASRILGLVGGGSGRVAIAVRPVVTAQYIYSAVECTDYASWGGMTRCARPVQTSTPDGTSSLWEVGLVAPPGDPFLVPTSSASVDLIAVPGGRLEASAAQSAGYVSPLGATQADILESSSRLLASPLAPVTLPDGSTRRTWRLYIPSPLKDAAPITDREWSFLIRRTEGSSVKYQLLLRRVVLSTDGANRPVTSTGTLAPVHYPDAGQHFAFGGSIGTKAAHAWNAASFDWSLPAFDAFGYPTSWIPPVDPTLGAVSDDSASTYLKSAKGAADEATTAVKSAIDELLREQADDATLGLAQKKASEVSKLEKVALCGDKNPKCDASTQKVDLGTYVPVVTCTGPLCEQLATLRSLATPAGITLFKAVWEVRNASAPPSFSEFEGGALQRAMVEQWTSLRKLQRVVTDAQAAALAKQGQVSVANAELAAAVGSAGFYCDQNTIANAVRAGYSFTFRDDESFSIIYGDADSLEWHLHDVSKSWSPGAAVAAINQCQDYRRGLPTAQARSAQTIAEAFSWLTTQGTAMLDAAGALQVTAAAGARVVGDSKLAVARSDMDAALAAYGLTTRFGSARRYHSYDVWRARALLDAARRYAAVARRAIEARFVLDMSSLQAVEPFVTPPATWADEVFEYDLDAPSAVGLTSIARSPGGVYANRMTDYVSNLERFSLGYAVARPTAATKRDDEIITLPGPDAKVTVGGAEVTSGAVGAWEFQCASSVAWFPHPGLSSTPGALATACSGSSPVRARLAFTLDPWARLGGTVAREPYSKRYNVRWARFALNVVGTGIKDCTRAIDPMGCYSEAFLRFHLTHSGPSWASTYDQQWRLLAPATGAVEGAKALTAEQWLDPVANGFGKPFVEAVARSEFAERPVDGGYLLVLETPPEVRFDRIDRLQVLLQSAYWVKQK